MSNSNGYAFYVDPYYRSRILKLDLIDLKPIAIGTLEQPILQTDCGIAIGDHAGYYQQQMCAIAIGRRAGTLFQGTEAVAIGVQAGAVDQGVDALALGTGAGMSFQRDQDIAIGGHSGAEDQRLGAIALGYEAGYMNQGTAAIAVGAHAGQTNQHANSIVLNASGSALNTQTASAWYVQPIRNSTGPQVLFYDPNSKEIVYGSSSTTIPNGTTYSDYLFWDTFAGAWGVGSGKVHLGGESGKTNQGAGAVALGAFAGHTNQGANAIAIGNQAGMTNQPAGSIVLNASGSALGTVTQANAWYVAPVQSKTTSNILFYNTTSKEISYGLPPNPIANGTTYSDYLFWDTASSAWAVGSNKVHVGGESGKTNQGAGAVALGAFAGHTNQGVNAIAIGNRAGMTNQPAGSIVLNASGSALGTVTQANALYVHSVRSDTAAQMLYYDPVSKEVVRSALPPISTLAGTTYSDYLFWDTASGAWAVGSNKVHLGGESGKTNQGAGAVAVGAFAGHTNQGANAIAIGNQAGMTNQPAGSIVLNASGSALTNVTKPSAWYVSPIGPGTTSNVLYYDTNTQEITVGSKTGIVPNGTSYSDYLYWEPSSMQWQVGMNEVHLGSNAGKISQLSYAVAVGSRAGENTQGGFAVAVGSQAGCTAQGTSAVALGAQAGSVYQNENAVALGNRAGELNQSFAAVAIGNQAGNVDQDVYAVAIGALAGYTSQGSCAIAIGYQAGKTNQPDNSIVLNASGAALTTITQASAWYVAPVRSGTAPEMLFYDVNSKEIVRGNAAFTNLSMQTSTYAYFQARDAVMGKMMLTDCADKDAFYRLRVSSPSTLYEGSTIYDSNLVFFDDDVTAGASITGPGTNAAMVLTVNAGSTLNAYAARQSHFYAHYQPGKSFLAYFSFCFGAAVTGIVQRVGLYDVDTSNANNPKNGVLLQLDGSVLAWVLYNGNGGIQYAEQAGETSWNVDPLNGTGPSGLTLDPTKNLLGFVDLEWLGVGRVRVGFFINGVPIICHTFNNTGLSLPYLNNPLLPVRYEVRRTVNTATAAATMTAVCCSIMSEGGFDPIGIVRTFQSGQLTLNAGEVKYALAVRLRSGYPRALLRAISMEIVSDLGGGANIAYFSLYLWRPSSSAVPSSTTWTNVSTTLGGSGSFVEYSNPGQSGATDLYTQMQNDTGGMRMLIDQGSINSTSKTTFNATTESLLVAQSSVDPQNRDIFLIVINNPVGAGNNKNYTALFTWREI